MKQSIVYFLLVAVLSSGCGIISIKKTRYAPSEYAGYSEDLSVGRVQFPELPKMESTYKESGKTDQNLAVDADLEEAISFFTRENKEERYFSGFTILVYSGVDRDMAFKTRNDLYSSFPDIKADMQYQQPRYLVKVGKYINRIEALASFDKIKKEFPSARIIQDRFQREGWQSEEDIENAEK